MKFMLDTTYHIVELHAPAPKEVIKWCDAKFGDGKDGRWRSMMNKIYFKNKHDHLLFTLRWS